jgi:putative endonuclease
VGDRRAALGKAGENLACRELEQRGLSILARRYRRRGGEIDIVARDGPTVVFVEVKTRGGTSFGAGAEALTEWKRRRITRLAEDFLMRHRLVGCPCRFDVVVIDVASGRPAIEVFHHAFDATS